MRSMIFAALVAATTVSVASAENDQDKSKPWPPPSPPSSPPSSTSLSKPLIDQLPGISPEQQAKIPYIPCTEALGWAHGRLRCNNRY
jgi:hypothetical protein